MSRYFEKLSQSKEIRHEQYNQLKSYLNIQLKKNEEKRKAYFQPDFCSVEKYLKSIEAYRQEYRQVIGYPPSVEEAPLCGKETYVGEDALCSIYRVWIRASAELECYGLYMVPKALQEKAPLVLTFHGGGGCPELLSNFEYPGNYNDASRRFLAEGYIVFAPLFTFQSYADGEDTIIAGDCRATLDLSAKWCGTSLAAIELFKVEKALEYLLEKEEVDSGKVGTAGLSYGGFYALLLAALDTRIRFCISSCYFNHRVAIHRQHPHLFGDWTWNHSLAKFTDVEMAAFICPRLCIIEVGTKDTVFPVETAREESAKVNEVYERLGIPQSFQYIEFDGEHEFDLHSALEHLRRILGSKELAG